MSSWADVTEDDDNIPTPTTTTPAWTSHPPRIPEMEVLQREKEIERNEPKYEPSRHLEPVRGHHNNNHGGGANFERTRPNLRDSGFGGGSGRASDRWKKFAEDAEHQGTTSSQQRQHDIRRGNTGSGRDFNSSGPRQQSFRAPPPAPKISQGVIVMLKESFGFLHVVSEPITSDVFFSFHEASRNRVDVSKLHTGDEMEFEIVNGKDGRLSASYLKALERGTIAWDRVNENKVGLTGIVVHDSQQGHSSRSLTRTRSNSNDFANSGAKFFQGRIAVLQDAADDACKEFVPHVEGNVPPDGDAIIAFGPRGIVSKNDTDDSSSVGSSQSRNVARSRGHGPSRGDLVQFDVAEELSSGRIHAINIKVIKSRGKRFRDIIRTAVESGDLVRDRGVLMSLNQTGSGGAFHHHGSFLCENAQEHIPFYKLDLPAEILSKLEAPKQQDGIDWRRTVIQPEDSPLEVGMEFSFGIMQDPVNPGKSIAVDLTVIPKGTVVQEVAIGTRVRAVLVDMHRVKDTSSSTHHHHKPGEKGLHHRRLSDVREPVVGSIKLLDEVEGVKSPLEFAVEDFVSAGPKALKGDIVSVDIYKHKHSGKISVRHVYMIEPGDEEARTSADSLGSWQGLLKRETGVVSNVLENFGFIDCCDRDGQIFYPFKEVILDRNDTDPKDPKPPVLQKGDYVSFQTTIEVANHKQHNKKGNNRNQDNSQRRTVAVRILKIESASPYALVEEGVLGTIARGVHTHQKTPTERVVKPGKIHCEPSKFVAPEVYKKMQQFRNHELRPKGGDASSDHVMEFLSDATGNTNTNNSTFHKSGGGGGNNKKPPAETPVISIKVPATVQKLARTYARWLGLNAVTSHNENGSLEVLSITHPPKEAEHAPQGGEILYDLKSFDDGGSKRSRHFRHGDKVKFSIVFNKRTSSFETRDMELVEAAPKAYATERRPNTEVGVIANFKGDSGFIQSTTRHERLHFVPSDAESNYQHDIEPGDEVEYVYASGKKGPKATELRPLKPGTIILDTFKDQTVYRGVITKEAKTSHDMKGGNKKLNADHPLATKLAHLQLSSHNWGRLVDATHMNANVDSRRGATTSQGDWRRGMELHKKVIALRDGDEPVLEATGTREELREIERSAKTLQLVFSRKSGSIIVAKSQKQLREYLKDKAHRTGSNEEAEDHGVADEDDAEAMASDDAADKEKDNATNYYVWTIGDVIHTSDTDEWIPCIGDEVEFKLCTNNVTKKVRATDLKLLNGASKIFKGVVEGTLPNGGGFIRPHAEFAGKGGAGLFGAPVDDKVDESFKPGAGGRDGTLRFDRQQVRDGNSLMDGDEVEYVVSVNPSTHEAKAIRVRLIKRGEPVSEIPRFSTPPQVNKELLKKMQQSNAVPRYTTAKGPDGTPGFPAGRGRNLPPRTKLRVTAKEFKPSY